MNQCGLIDSKLSLDEMQWIGDFMRMITQPYRLYIERIDPAHNMARFYAMQISTSLFGQACLTRQWGRIGTYGQTVIAHFDEEEEAVRLFLALIRQKRVRGYRPKPPDPRPLS